MLRYLTRKSIGLSQQFSKLTTPSTNQTINHTQIDLASSISGLIQIAPLKTSIPLPILIKILINPNVKFERVVIEWLHRLIYHMHSISSVITFSTNQLFNFQFTFKKLKQVLGEQYSPKRFEGRLTISAQKIPKLATNSYMDNLAISLLHIVSTFTKTSQPDLKFYLNQYFYQYNSQFFKVNYEKPNKFRPLGYLVILTDLLISDTFIGPQNQIFQVALLSLQKHQVELFAFLKTHKFIEVFNEFFENKNVRVNFNKQLVNKKLMTSKFISQINKMKDKNTQMAFSTVQKYLLSANYFVSVLNLNPKMLLIHQIDCKIYLRLVKYFYCLFMLSDDMKINLSTMRDKTYLTNTLHNSSQSSFERVSLWKVSLQILQGLHKNLFYIQKKDQLMTLITYKTLDYLNKSESVNELQIELIKNGEIILNIISLLPICSLAQYSKQNQNINQIIFRSLKIIGKNYHKNTKLTKSLLKLAKYKKTLLFSKKKWMQILHTLIQKDKQIENWELYFFIAQSCDQELQSLIPFQRIINKISQDRLHLQDNFINNFNIRKFDNEFKNKNINLEKIKKSRDWQINLLKLHALAIQMKIINKLPDLLKNNSKCYPLTVQFIQQVFEIWMTPLDVFETTAAAQKAYHDIGVNRIQISRQEYKQYFACYPHYFDSIFTQTNAFHQYDLLNKIINSKLFNNKNSRIDNPELNYIFYFYTMLMALGDKKHKVNYIEKLNVNNIDYSLMSQHSCFKNIHQQIINDMQQIQQWKYLIQFYSKYNSVFKSRYLYWDILPLHNLYKSAVVQKIRHKQQQWYWKGVNFVEQYNFDDRSQGKYCNLLSIYVEKAKDYLEQIKKIDKNQKNQKNEQKNIGQFVYWVYQITKYLSKNHQLKIDQILNTQQIDQLNKIIIKIQNIDSEILRKSIHYMGLLNIIHQSTLIKILVRIKTDKKVDLMKLTCWRLLGKSKIISQKLATAQDIEKIDHDMYKVGSQNPHSLMWFLANVALGSKRRFQIFYKLYLWYLDPFDRKVIYDSLVLRQRQDHLEQFSIKFEAKFTIDHKFIGEDASLSQQNAQDIAENLAQLQGDKEMVEFQGLQEERIQKKGKIQDREFPIQDKKGIKVSNQTLHEEKSSKKVLFSKKNTK